MLLRDDTVLSAFHTAVKQRVISDLLFYVLLYVFRLLPNFNKIALKEFSLVFMSRSIIFAFWRAVSL